jgi:hypothetical protein
MTRAVILVLLGAFVVVALAAVGYSHVFGTVDGGGSHIQQPTPATSTTSVTSVTTPATTAPPPAAAWNGAPDDITTVLVSRRGAVQVRHGDNAWGDAETGKPLGPDDVVRAGRNAEATLQLGNGIEVRLSPRSELRIRELTDAVARVRLDAGHVTATVDGGSKRILRVQTRDSDAEASSTGGTFGVVTDGRGQLAVAATTGHVKVTAKGTSVDVGAGQGTTVDANAAPRAPTATPASLFLKLGALAATQTNQTATTVNGTTAPGALVRVGEQVTTSDANGRFSLRVPLRDGRNELAVEVVDASGRAQDQRLPAVVVDRQKPSIDAAVQWGKP